MMIDQWMWSGGGNGIIVPLIAAAVVFVALFLSINAGWEKYKFTYRIARYINSLVIGNPTKTNILLKFLRMILLNESYVQIGLAVLLTFPATKLVLKYVVL